MRPISYLPRISLGLTIAELSSRLRCFECGEPVHSVKPWRLDDVLGKRWGAGLARVREPYAPGVLNFSLNSRFQILAMRKGRALVVIVATVALTTGTVGCGGYRTAGGAAVGGAAGVVGGALLAGPVGAVAGGAAGAATGAALSAPNEEQLR
jgi:hypothetical protein